MRKSINRARNSKNKRETPIPASASDDLRTTGLRVLAKLIAQEIRVRRLGHGCLQTGETFKARERNGESLP